jgi:hypothetical protein
MVLLKGLADASPIIKAKQVLLDLQGSRAVTENQ